MRIIKSFSLEHFRLLLPLWPQNEFPASGILSYFSYQASAINWLSVFSAQPVSMLCFPPQTLPSQGMKPHYLQTGTSQPWPPLCFFSHPSSICKLRSWPVAICWLPASGYPECSSHTQSIQSPLPQLDPLGFSTAGNLSLPQPRCDWGLYSETGKWCQLSIIHYK